MSRDDKSYDRNDKRRSSRRRNNKQHEDRPNAKGPKEVDVNYNDVSWYTANGQIVKDVASLSFNNALGAPTVLRYSNGGDIRVDNFNWRVPGIAVIPTAPCYGVSINGASALNLAAKNFYTFIRHQNSGHANYDSPDLMLYFGAMDSIYAVIAWMQRIYGTAMVFSQRNRYIGDALIKAMGADPVEIRANLADFRAFINMCIIKASAFCTPRTMFMYDRHFWMYSGIYKDAPVDKAQMYLYTPAAVWKYTETSGAPGYLKTISWCSNIVNDSVAMSPWSLGTIYNSVNELLGAVVASEDINIMSGDVLKAYGQENLWKMALIPENYAVFPVYSEEVLDQIHNTVFAGNKPTSCIDLSVNPSTTWERLDITQDPSIGDGHLRCQPQFRNAAHLGFDVIMDSHKDQPTPEEVIVSTRNVLTGDASQITASGVTPGVNVTTLTSAGSDICLFMNVLNMTDGSGLGLTPIGTSQGGGINQTTLATLSVFNQYPHLLTLSTGANSPSLFGEVDNFTVISHDDVQRMHDSALLSLLGVPFIGTAG